MLRGLRCPGLYKNVTIEINFFLWVFLAVVTAANLL